MLDSDLEALYIAKTHIFHYLTMFCEGSLFLATFIVNCLLLLKKMCPLNAYKNEMCFIEESTVPLLNFYV